MNGLVYFLSATMERQSHSCVIMYWPIPLHQRIIKSRPLVMSSTGKLNHVAKAGLPTGAFINLLNKTKPCPSLIVAQVCNSLCYLGNDNVMEWQMWVILIKSLQKTWLMLRTSESTMYLWVFRSRNHEWMWHTLCWREKRKSGFKQVGTKNTMED